MVDSTVAVVEGTVLGSQRFLHLYQLLDLERDAAEEWQRLSMPAAFEVLNAFEAGDWQQDKQAEWDAYVEKHGYQPPASTMPKPTTREAFYKWVQERAERDGHPPRTRSTIQKLKYAAECFSLAQGKINKNATAVAKLPQEERAWRPVYSMLTQGWHEQIAAVAERAVEIAEGEAKAVDSGVMSLARAEIEKTDPRMREHREQPGLKKFGDVRTKHDRAVTAYNAAVAAVEELRRVDDGEMWGRFYDYIWELGK